MKKIYAFLVSLTLCISAIGQTPVITATTTLPVGSEISYLNIGAVAANTPIQIDFGDGVKVDKIIGVSPTPIVGTIGSSQTLKIYGSGIDFFQCYLCELTTLDVSNCNTLEFLSVPANSLTALDVTKNTALTSLACYGNYDIKTLDLTKNKALESLTCYLIHLTAIDLTQNTELTYLQIGINNLKTLDVTKNTKLKTFYCDMNDLSQLDISANPLITNFDCSNNRLSFSSIPLNRVSFTSYGYAPQKAINITKNVKVGTELDLSSEYSIGGNISTFTWKTKTSGTALVAGVDYTITSGKTTFLKPQADSVYCEMTNATFPSLIGANALKTTNVKVKALQSITFNALPDKKTNDAAFTISAVASSGLAVTFTSSDPSVASVSGNTVTIKKAGAVTITAAQVGDNLWEAAPSVAQTLTISKATQTITFNALPAKKANDAAFTISATATSGLAVTFTSSDPSTASVSGNTVTIKKAGSVTITAAQAGDGIWDAATSVTQTLTINKVTQTITFSTLPAKKANDAAFTILATATSGLAVTFTSSDPSIASVNSNTVTIKKAGTVTITATQAGDDIWSAATSVTQTLTINKVTQTITFSTLPAKKANDAAFTISATATSGLAATFTSSDPSIASVSGNTVTIKKAGSVTITASQTGDDIWSAATSVTQTLTINKATQTITFSTLPTKKANDAAFSISATATSTFAVIFTSSDPSIASVSGNTVTIKKAGAVTITASQAGDDIWGAATSVTQTLTITKVNQTISFDALPAKKISDAPFTIAASASSGLAITFASSDPSVASVSGNTITLKKTGTVSITASQAGDDTWNAIAATQKLVITTDQLATQAQTITFNALPGKSTNDTPFTISATASSGLVVTFTSSDPSIASVTGNTVTIKKAGTVTITADQVGDNTWAPAASVAQTLTIGKQSQTITFSTLPAKKVGDAAFELTATASSSLSITYTSSNSLVASISGSTVTILKAGTVTITATQAGNDNWSSATAEQTLTITSVTGIGEEKENLFSVYPNPTADMLYFKGEGSENMYISIFNLAGTKVWSGIAKGQSIDISQLPAGVYILKTNSKETQTIRFVKQ